ncbi:protein of unknown function (plasmid) [Thermococcus nautili]|nr:protein of unknown function [Thermococcus nautili]
MFSLSYPLVYIGIMVLPGEASEVLKLHRALKDKHFLNINFSIMNYPKKR